jgi:hypothetical protein
MWPVLTAALLGLRPRRHVLLCIRIIAACEELVERGESSGAGHRFLWPVLTAACGFAAAPLCGAANPGQSAQLSSRLRAECH